MHLLCYVDDFLLAGSTKKECEAEREKILDLFPRGGRKIDLDATGTMKFLGLDIQFKPEIGEIRVSQASLIQTVAERFGLSDAAPAKKPIDGFLVPEGEPAPPGNAYRSMVGSLMYLAVNTRCDIAFAIKELSRFLENPTVQHIAAAKNVIKWVKATADYAVVYRKDPNYERHNVSKIYQFYCDSDFANEKPGRKSTTGTVAMLGSAPVQWRSVQQKLAAQST